MTHADGNWSKRVNFSVKNQNNCSFFVGKVIFKGFSIFDSGPEKWKNSVFKTPKFT